MDFRFVETSYWFVWMYPLLLVHETAIYWRLSMGLLYRGNQAYLSFGSERDPYWSFSFQDLSMDNFQVFKSQE